jgi:hypothetical protein
MGEIRPETVQAIQQGMARALAADTNGDKAACEQALAEVQRTLVSRPLKQTAQSVWGGSPSNLSLAANAAIRRSASARVRLGLYASSS